MPVVSSLHHLFAKPLLYTQFGMVSIIAYLLTHAVIHDVSPHFGKGRYENHNLTS